jgi:predicted NodU family carbamoyl transferase
MGDNYHFKGEGKKIEILKEIHFPHSIGMLYSAFTYFLGFKVNSGEYKLMGLSPYGNKNSEEVIKFKQLIYKNLNFNQKETMDFNSILNISLFSIN